MAHTRRFAAYAGLVAAFSMAATPGVAADLPVSPTQSSVPTPGAFDKDSENVNRYRYYRYPRYHRYRRHRVDAGDVLAGVLVIGTIAAIASAASKNNRNDRYRERDYRYRERDRRDRAYDYRDRRGDSRYSAGRGIDNAVSMCVSKIERDVRVESVDTVDRSGSGWRVGGALYNGERFNCEIGENGQIKGIEYGGFSARQNSQLKDDRYRSAWNDFDRGLISAPDQNRQTPAPASPVESAQAIPAYPGGPLPDDQIDSDFLQDDRYNTAEAPDFGGRS